MDRFFLLNRKPAVEGNPIRNFRPVSSDELHFLNITNEGLIMQKNPYTDRMKFIEYVIKEAKRLIEVHGETPTKTSLQLFCDRYALLHPIESDVI